MKVLDEIATKVARTKMITDCKLQITDKNKYSLRLCGENYIILLIFFLLLFAGNALAFQPLRSDNSAKVHWESGPVTYVINKSGAGACVADPVATINSAFSVWDSVSTMILEVNYGGESSSTNFCGMDNEGTGCNSTNLIVFSSTNFPAGVLAMTVNYYRIADGEIAGTDIAFNKGGFNWSDDPISHSNPACRGTDFYSLPAVAIHEIGHFYGLDHSFCSDVGATFTPGIAATMYPYYFDADWPEQLTLEQDDIAGVTWMYPDPALSGWGKIKGTVKYNNGVSMFGVQVTAIRASDKVPIVTTFTKGGKYLLYGLPPDDYYVYTNTPRCQGSIFTAFVSNYWRGPDRVPYILLYKQLKVRKLSSLVPDGAPFTKSGVKVITVVADTTRGNVNFTYPTP